MNGHNNYLIVRNQRQQSLAPRSLLGLGLKVDPANPARAAFTLAETLISIMIMGMVFATVLLGYTRSAQRASWSGFSLAAQAQSTKMLEEFRAVLWDTQNTPVRDDTTNVPTLIVSALELPVSGTNVVYCTNTATITNITLAGQAPIKMITVTTTWPWNGKTFTNTIVDYRAPDQ